MNNNLPSPVAKQLLIEQEAIELKLAQFEAIIGKARRGNMGLTLDADKTPEWHEAKRLYSMYWDAYRHVNTQLTKLRKVVGYEAVNGKRECIYEYK